jgi:hypothetical protein
MPVLDRFSSPTDNNSYEGKGIRSSATLIPYALTIALPVPTRRAFLHFFDFADLTGALTLNAADVSQYQEGDEIVFRFRSDANARVVTWGTNIRATGTFTVGAASTVHVGIAEARFMDGKIQITSTSSVVN